MPKLIQTTFKYSIYQKHYKIKCQQSDLSKIVYINVV